MRPTSETISNLMNLICTECGLQFYSASPKEMEGSECESCGGIVTQKESSE